MKPQTSYKLLSFYKFVDIPNPEEIVKEMKQFLTDIGVKGRIYIGEEGINATCSVNRGQYTALMSYLKNHKYFNDIPDIDDKAQEVDEHQFKKMIVRYRKEIVALGKVYKADMIKKAKYKLTPDEFKDLLDSRDPNSYLILDMRNNYEYKLGHFKNARPAGTMTFKETEQFIDDYRKRIGDKEVIMYCTGGIRCEKLAVLLQESGLENVKQLDGGVVKYVNKHNDGNWLGNLYTFDERVSTKVGDEDTHKVIATCYYSGEKTEYMHNCRYGMCNQQIISKPRYYRRYMGFCSKQCMENAINDLNIKDVDFDKLNYKDLRIQIKLEKITKEEVQEQVRRHLIRELSGNEIPFEKPIDESLTVDDYIE